MKLQILIAVAMAALSMTAQASDTANQSDQYLCVADKKTGFVYNNRLHAWDAATFQAGRKYIVSVSQLPGDAFQITEVGKSRPSGYCKEGFNEFGFLFCRMTVGEFRFNRNNGRFLHIYPVGYYGVGLDPEFTDEVSDTPSLEIGKCSHF